MRFKKHQLFDDGSLLLFIAMQIYLEVKALCRYMALMYRVLFVRTGLYSAQFSKWAINIPFFSLLDGYPRNFQHITKTGNKVG